MELIIYDLVIGMHIPDGFLTVPVALIWWILSAGMILVATKRTQASLDERQIPFMGVMAACIFAAQMLNFPVLGGTSGHLLGGAIVGLLLGPWAGILVMTCVIALQGLLFQDGGLLAMGANIFNMGIATSLIAAVVGQPMLRAMGSHRLSLAVAGFLTGWLSVMLAAMLTSLQLVLSGTAFAPIVFPSMLFVHAVIGVGEGLITMAALSFVVTTRPDLVTAFQVNPDNIERPIQHRTLGMTTLVGLAIALAAAFASPWASADPDGLERVAEDKGFINSAQEAWYHIMPDYTIPGIEGDISTILAGVIGVFITFGIMYMIIRLIRNRAHLSSEALD